MFLRTIIFKTTLPFMRTTSATRHVECRPRGMPCGLNAKAATVLSKGKNQLGRMNQLQGFSLGIYGRGAGGLKPKTTAVIAWCIFCHFFTLPGICGHRSDFSNDGPWELDVD